MPKNDASCNFPAVTCPPGNKVGQSQHWAIFAAFRSQTLFLGDGGLAELVLAWCARQNSQHKLQELPSLALSAGGQLDWLGDTYFPLTPALQVILRLVPRHDDCWKKSHCECQTKSLNHHRSAQPEIQDFGLEGGGCLKSQVQQTKLWDVHLARTSQELQS